jgi:hypothetical protein
MAMPYSDSRTALGGVDFALADLINFQHEATARRAVFRIPQLGPFGRHAPDHEARIYVHSVHLSRVDNTLSRWARVGIPLVNSVLAIPILARVGLIRRIRLFLFLVAGDAQHLTIPRHIEVAGAALLAMVRDARRVPEMVDA